MTTLILGISTLLQFTAAFLSVRLISITGRWVAFTLFAAAMTLMGVRRSISLYHSYTNPSFHNADISAELVALVISSLCVAGMLLIAPAFRRVVTKYEKAQISEEKYREVLDFLPQPLIEVDLSGSIVFTNEIGRELFGEIDRKDIRETKVPELICPEHRHRAKENIKDILNGSSTHANEYTLLNKNGDRFSALVYTAPIWNKGEISGMRTLVIDITERKKVEEQILDLEIIVNDSVNEVYLFDAESLQFVHVNQAALKNLGYAQDEIERMTALDLKPDFSVEEFEQKVEPLRTGKKKKVFFESRQKRKDASLYPVEVHLQLLEHENRSVFAAIVLDISERKKASEQLRKLSQAVEHSPSAVVILDLEKTIEYVNPKFTENTGYEADEIIGRKSRVLRSGKAPASLYEELWNTIRAGKTWKGELHNKRKDGSFYWDRTSITGIKNDKGEITHFISLQDDVTHEYELSKQLNYQASHDSLTGLVNRHEFERRIERLLSNIANETSQHAMSFMDLDQFKVVNDTCGHAAGDELLRQVSHILQTEVRKRDTLARLGGDEFGVLMEHCTPEQAQRVATTLQEALEEFQFTWDNHIFRISVSIGLVPINENTPNLTELFKQADAACYMAKDLGRNRIHVYKEDDVNMAKRHGEMQWVTKIYEALEENRYCLYAQKISALGNQSGHHYELLVRMRDTNNEIVPPGVFLPAAERYNLISRLDTWVIEEAFRQLAANPLFLLQSHFISINLSGQSLTKPDFAGWIISALDESGIDAGKICFEITETTAISNLTTAISFISTLKEKGCQFALDDFGSGLSSFGYLKNLPVDYLKIDGMFVRNIVEDPIDHAMVRSINEIGQVMGMQTIAEFVENDEIKGMLREIGVNYAQGYGMGKPQPFEEVLSNTSNISRITDAA